MKTSEPTLNQAYAIIVEEESQRSDVDRNSLGLKVVAEENDITAFWTTKHPPKLQYKSPNAFCDHCNTKVHIKNNCFQLIGYPPWYKWKKKYGSNVQYNVPLVFNPEYGGRNAGPSYGKLSFSHNHNPAGEIHRSVGGNGHTGVGAHTHGHVGLHGSHNSSGSNIIAYMCAHGCGST